MHVTQSKDLIHWELFPLKPVLRASDKDREIANPSLSQADRQRIATATNIINSDLDFCEFNGRWISNSSWRNRQGMQHLAKGVYQGTEKQFLSGWCASR